MFDFSAKNMILFKINGTDAPMIHIKVDTYVLEIKNSDLMANAEKIIEIMIDHITNSLVARNKN